MITSMVGLRKLKSVIHSVVNFFLSPYQPTSININGFIIESSNPEKLLGITFDSDFEFEEQIAKNCMLYLEFYNIYHNAKRRIYSKRL